jgi:predicted Zn-dependent peptidase
MRFVIAGKLHGRKSEIIRNLEEWDLPEGERFAVPKDDLTSANPVLVRRKEASNLTFGWSMTIPRELSDEEADAMSCLDHILTGTMSSRIFGSARKKGLAYGMFSDTSVNFHDSSWDFGGQVNLDTASGLFDIIVRELRAVLDGNITEEEIDAAKSYALGRYQMGAQTVSQISNFYTNRYFADDIVKDYDKVPDSIKKTSRECIINTAREFIEHNAWVMAGVSSGEKSELVELNDKLAKLFNQQ